MFLFRLFQGDGSGPDPEVIVTDYCCLLCCLSRLFLFYYLHLSAPEWLNTKDKRPRIKTDAPPLIYGAVLHQRSAILRAAGGAETSPAGPSNAPLGNNCRLLDGSSVFFPALIKPRASRDTVFWTADDALTPKPPAHFPSSAFQTRASCVLFSALFFSFLKPFFFLEL